MSFRRLAGAAVVLALSVGGLLLGGSPAQAHHSPATIDVVEVGDCGQVEFTTTSNAGDDHAGNTETLVVSYGGTVETAAMGEALTVGPFTAETLVRWRVFGGGERDYDVPAWTGYVPGPGPWRDSIGQYIADNGDGWLLGDTGDPFTTWSELTVEGCPEPAPTPTPTVEPSPSPSPSIGPPASGQGGSGDQLPVTGSFLPVLLIGGTSAAFVGTGALLFARRLRAPRFTAE